MPTKAKPHRPAHSHDRGSAASRGYDARWRKARLAWLREYPLCVHCKAAGIITAANVVDHIQPHKGSQALFWNRDNWQSLCKPHHDEKTLAEIRKGS